MKTLNSKDISAEEVADILLEGPSYAAAKENGVRFDVVELILSMANLHEINFAQYVSQVTHAINPDAADVAVNMREKLEKPEAEEIRTK